MVEARKSAFRSLLNNRLVRIPLATALGVAALVISVIAAAAIYNAFDEDLTPEAKAMLAPPPMGKIEDRNGYIAYLGLSAPAGQDQMEWGRKAAAAYASESQPGFSRTPEWKLATGSHFKAPADQAKWCTLDCLSEAKRDRDTAAARVADPHNAELLARYRVVRQAPEFADLYFGALTLNAPWNSALFQAGAKLSLAEAAAKSDAGDLEPMVSGLEQEVAFHRRMIGGGRTLVSVLNGETALARDLLTVSELLRSDGERAAPYTERLRKLARPQVSAKALRPAFALWAHQNVSWAQHWQKLLRETTDDPTPDSVMKMMSNRAMSLFMRPNETVNLVASIMRTDASIADVPAEQFDREAGSIRAAHEALLERPWYTEARNPVGKGVAAVVANGRVSPYAARMNDLHALERMVELQATLASRMIVEPDAIARFVAGEGANRDPYTGKAFAFDPAQRLLSFEPRSDDRWKSELKKRFGSKAAIAL